LEAPSLNQPKPNLNLRTHNLGMIPISIVSANQWQEGDHFEWMVDVSKFFLFGRTARNRFRNELKHSDTNKHCIGQSMGMLVFVSS
jgi:hypothetical protein